jgi:hypothetical protein
MINRLYFGEDGEKGEMKWEQFFGIFGTFIADYQTALDDINAKKEKESKVTLHSNQSINEPLNEFLMIPNDVNRKQSVKKLRNKRPSNDQKVQPQVKPMHYHYQRIVKRGNQA